jgi:hypothetical protein
MQNSINRMQYIKKVLDPKNLTDKAYPVFMSETPVRTGNARNSTKKTANSINANYPYAGRLDRGWSRQSPQGMTKPTIEYLRDYIRKALASKSTGTP